MALSSPLSLSEFWEKFILSQLEMAPRAVNRVDRTAGGTILKASQGDTLWRGSVAASPGDRYGNHFELEALISFLDRPGETFLAYDTRKPYPASDPDGSSISGNTPKIQSVAGNNKEMAVKGLPAGYILTAGDLIGWQYGSSPTRYALHRLLSGATANGSGITGNIEVTPFIQPGAAADINVTLVKPVMKAVLAPDPDFGMGGPAFVAGAKFSFVQTLR